MRAILGRRTNLHRQGINTSRLIPGYTFDDQ